MLPSPASTRVAIVGGGLSGLATAVQLRREMPDVSITLFESSARLGGVIDTHRHGDFLVDYGADMFTTQPPAAIELLRQLGVADKLLEPKTQGRGAMIVFRGRLVPIPAGFVLMRATQLSSMLTTPLLSIRGKLQLAAERFVPPGDGSRDESVASFVRRRMGQEVLDRIVGPLVAGIYTADVERLSMQATMAPILKMEQQYGSLAQATFARRKTGDDGVERSSSGARYAQFRAFSGGMIELIQTLQNNVGDTAIHLETPVRRLEQSDEKWRLLGAHDLLGEFDEVVLATPAAVAATLLRDHSIVAADTFAEIETASTAVVVLGLQRQDIRRPAAAFGVVVPPIENRQILAASFASEKFAGRASSDQVIARVFIGGALQSELLRLSDDKLIKLAINELGELIGLTGVPVMQKVVRWTNAMPQYHVGHLDRVATIERELKSLPGISVAGNSLYGVGIAPVIETAGKIAKKIAAATA